MRWCSTANAVPLAREGSPTRIDCGKAGFGTWYLGSIRSVNQLAETHERAGLISAVYVVSYLAFSIPALVPGVPATHIVLRETSLGYGSLIALIAFSALAFARLNAPVVERATTGTD